jgi:TolA-binding protein
LEEAAVALSMASPPKRAPRRVWTRIESALAIGHRKPPAIFRSWWRNGWAAAAACLLGWLLYAIWSNRPGSPNTPSAPLASEKGASPELSEPQLTVATPTRQVNPDNNAAMRLLQARTQELGVLSWQIAQLTNQVSHLSQTLTQQQALLSEASRLKFFQLSSVPGAEPGAAPGPGSLPISPGLQRALALAMARELGWTPTATPSSSPKPGGPEERSGTSPSSTVTNQAGVDFVDLKPGNSNSVDNSSSLPRPDLDQVASADPAPFPTTNGVPGFISGTNAVLAFDGSVAPVGSALTFWAHSAGQFQSLGGTMLGINPTVVSVPFRTFGAQSIAVLAGTTNGSIFFIGQFATPAPPGP